ncbi:ATP-binding protein [Cellulomonas sp. JH27-2]|uniref:ATP-binding protein n=1 Tax=Cellulomonas sp. JH27-2 TaxID=2774139 RepID=UPI00177B6E2C|nr:ATP-binding protein [Cellulomonas sp. JH27-2]MBD8058065.1 ATP-binding protein [Cellulomonas sp. JH27-2]
MSRPPVGYTPLAEWELGSPEQLGGLRTHLNEHLAAQGFASDAVKADTPSKIVLIASELATNALRHGLPPTIVRLHRQGASFLLEVTDHDQAAAPLYAGERRIGEGGLGLHLARELSLDVGWYAGPASKTVWATFDAAGTPTQTPLGMHGPVGSAQRLEDGTIVLVGELDAGLTEQLLEMAQAVRPEDAPVAIDLGAVTFIDSTVVRFLSLVYRFSHAPVVLLGASERTRFLIDAMGVSDIVELRD